MCSQPRASSGVIANNGSVKDAQGVASGGNALGAAVAKSPALSEDHEAYSEVASAAAVDFSGYPLKIRVKCSPVERVNGIYSRATHLRNGKPYYNSLHYLGPQLFLHGKEWKFGNVSKPGFYAKVKANQGQTLPTEPYPFAWTVSLVRRLGQQAAQDAPAMRVIDLDLDVGDPAEAVLPAQPCHAATPPSRPHTTETKAVFAPGKRRRMRTRSGYLRRLPTASSAKDADAPEESVDVLRRMRTRLGLLAPTLRAPEGRGRASHRRRASASWTHVKVASKHASTHARAARGSATGDGSPVFGDGTLFKKADLPSSKRSFA